MRVEIGAGAIVRVEIGAGGHCACGDRSRGHCACEDRSRGHCACGSCEDVEDSVMRKGVETWGRGGRRDQRTCGRNRENIWRREGCRSVSQWSCKGLLFFTDCPNFPSDSES